MNRFATPDPIAVHLELVVGHARVEAADRIDTVVTVSPSRPERPGDVAAAEQTTVDLDHDVLTVKAPKGWRQWMPWSGDASIDVVIEVPSGSDLRGSAALATIRTSGRLGELRYKVSSGDLHVDEAAAVDLTTSAGSISVQRATGRVEVRTSVGTVRIGTVDGVAVIKNTSGDTEIREVTGDVEVSSANGAIRVDRAGSAVRAKTANGDVTIGQVSRGAVTAQTARGDVEIGVRDGVAAWLDLHTGFGATSNQLDASGPPAAGEDSVEVRASTAFGDITIRRSRTEAHTEGL
jgi:DUF4097 and DUF4098 domain-containing protein YvlB